MNVSQPESDHPDKKKHFKVSAGVIWRNEKLLIARRQADDVFGGLWEFPGGKCEPGETLQEALIREIAEEMDFEIQVGNLMTRLEYNADHVSFSFYVFECQYRSGIPKTVECDDFKWITPDALSGYRFTELDQEVIKKFF